MRDLGGSGTGPRMAMPQMDESKMRLVQELEIEMMTDMYAKLTSACHKKVRP